MRALLVLVALSSTLMNIESALLDSPPADPAESDCCTPKCNEDNFHIEKEYFFWRECSVSKDCAKMLPLCQAVIKNKLEAVKMLHLLGDDLRGVDCDGFKLWNLAAVFGRVSILEYLIDKKVWSRSSDADANECTALHYAAKNGHFNAVNYIESRFNVDLKLKTAKGHTALQLANYAVKKI